MTDIHPGPLRAPDRSRRRPVRATAVTMTLLMLGLVTACVPPEPPADPYGLRSTLGKGELVLDWHAPTSEPVEGYDLQILEPAGSWRILQSTEDSTATLTDLTPRTRYLFRVRTASTTTTPPGTWGETLAVMYVDLVLPVVRIETDGHAPILDRENYVRASLQLDPNGSGFDAYSGTMGIRGRGNSTWTLDKKPFRMKLDTKSPIMGIAAERDWVLLANAMDRSQLRTFGAMQASEATDLDYTPTLRHVEVVLNGKYNGVYLLTQHNEIGKDRVNITEMGSEDNSGEALTGGYRLEIDARLEENNEPGFRTARDKPVVVKDPDPMTAEQRTYIRGQVQAFEDALHAPNFADPELGYRKYLHVDTFIDHYLVQELTRNQDAFWASTFFTKERGDERFKFGPVWDFDASLGTTSAYAASPPEGWRTRTVDSWTRAIIKDPAYEAELIARWDELKPQFSQIPEQIEALGTQLAPAVANDAFNWFYTPTPADQPEFISDWLTTRIAWMDSAFHAAP